MTELEQRAAAVWSELRRRRGLMTRIAKQLAISPAAVGEWRLVPRHRLYEVASIACVSWQRLRPDIAAEAREYALAKQLNKLLRDKGTSRASGNNPRSRKAHTKPPKKKIKSAFKSKHSDLSVL